MSWQMCAVILYAGNRIAFVFLFFPVGSKGSVLSVEIREDHHRRAVQNYRCWRTSWSVRQGEEWPDNVQFHKADLCTASPLLAGQAFHAVSVRPQSGATQSVLRFVNRH